MVGACVRWSVWGCIRKSVLLGMVLEGRDGGKMAYRVWMAFGGFGVNIRELLFDIFVGVGVEDSMKIYLADSAYANTLLCFEANSCGWTQSDLQTKYISIPVVLLLR